MIVSIAASLAAVVGFAAIATRRWATPRLASWLLVTGSLVTAGATLGAVLLAAWPLVARIPAVAGAGEWRANDVGGAVAVPLTVSWCAAVVAAVMLTRTIVAVASLVGQWRGVWSTHRALAGTSDFVVVDDPLARAEAIPAVLFHPGRTVVTTGILERLTADERRALLAHERSHLRHRHAVFASLAEVAVAINPLLGPARHELSFQLERWADEDASVVAGRPSTARAVAKAALGATRPMASATMSIAGVGVVCRVEQLIAAEPLRTHRGMVAAFGVVLSLAVVAVLIASRDMERAFEALQAVRR